MQGVFSVRKILIVGAGQAGLQLALSLQAEGYDVTLMSARTPEEIRNGWPTSTQMMMYRALDRAVRAGRRPGDLPLGDDLRPGGPRADVRPDRHRGGQGRDRGAVRHRHAEDALHAARAAPGRDLPERDRHSRRRAAPEDAGELAARRRRVLLHARLQLYRSLRRGARGGRTRRPV